MRRREVARVATDPGDDASGSIERVLTSMQDRLDSLPDRLRHQRVFLGTYRRMTAAVGDAISAGQFEDPVWVRRWDVAFVEFYLSALDREIAGDQGVPAPWRRAFGAPEDLPSVRHVLLGINAHINFDLPQALLALISDEDFNDAELMAIRQRDHHTVDGVLASHVSAESDQLAGPEGLRPLDRLLLPVNRWGSRRFLREARTKVWQNTVILNESRRHGPEALVSKRRELEALADAKVADLLRPGQVLLRLTLQGFGVRLSPGTTSA
jgi:hypothetical protein